MKHQHLIITCIQVLLNLSFVSVWLLSEVLKILNWYSNKENKRILENLPRSGKYQSFRNNNQTHKWCFRVPFRRGRSGIRGRSSRWTLVSAWQFTTCSWTSLSSLLSSSCTTRSVNSWNQSFVRRSSGLVFVRPEHSWVRSHPSISLFRSRLVFGSEYKQRKLHLSEPKKKQKMNTHTKIPWPKQAPNHARIACGKNCSPIPGWLPWMLVWDGLCCSFSPFGKCPSTQRLVGFFPKTM